MSENITAFKKIMHCIVYETDVVLKSTCKMIFTTEIISVYKFSSMM